LTSATVQINHPNENMSNSLIPPNENMSPSVPNKPSLSSPHEQLIVYMNKLKALEIAEKNKDPNDPEGRVTIWNKVECRKKSGNAAPKRKNIARYLAEHPDCEPYTGQDLKPGQKKRNQRRVTSESVAAFIAQEEKAAEEIKQAEKRRNDERIALMKKNGCQHTGLPEDSKFESEPCVDQYYRLRPSCAIHMNARRNRLGIDGSLHPSLVGVGVENLVGDGLDDPYGLNNPLLLNTNQWPWLPDVDGKEAVSMTISCDSDIAALSEMELDFSYGGDEFVGYDS